MAWDGWDSHTRREEEGLPSALSGRQREALGQCRAGWAWVSLKGTLRTTLRLFSALVLSGRLLLLLLQADSCETGRPPLLPGLAVAAEGVHASPKVTTSCPVHECLSFW